MDREKKKPKKWRLGSINSTFTVLFGVGYLDSPSQNCERWEFPHVFYTPIIFNAWWFHRYMDNMRSTCFPKDNHEEDVVASGDLASIGTSSSGSGGFSSSSASSSLSSESSRGAHQNPWQMFGTFQLEQLEMHWFQQGTIPPPTNLC